LNRHVSGDIVYLTLDRLDAVSGLVHAVSTRVGGVSREPYDSLNLGLHVEDDARAVCENRRRFAAAVAFPLEAVVSTRQVHGTDVRVVGRLDRGHGAQALPDESWNCDALVTSARGVFLMGFSADCPLILLVDRAASAVGLVHAGWRPAFSDIVGKTVSAMRKLGAEPERMLAGISPAIGPCCYEVDRDFRDAFPDDVDRRDRFFRPHGQKFLFDLPLFCHEMLRRSGLCEEYIESAGTCTRCNEELFFSHRASGGRTGRFAVVIGWTE